MRILQLLSSTGFHGAEAMAAELVKNLAASGAQVEVAVLDNAGAGDAEIFEHVAGHATATHRLPCRGALDLGTVRALGALLQRRNIQLVHSHKYKTTFYALLLRPWLRFGMVTTYHNWILNTPALRAYARLDKALARFNSQAVAVSTPVFQALQPHVPPARLAQVDNGIDTVRFAPGPVDTALRAQLCAQPERPLLGFVGRLSQEKGLPHLLQALARPELAGVQLAVVGDGDERVSLQQQASLLGLGERVRWLGHRRDTPALYLAFDLLALPSLVEAFPMVLLEAMASGKPVVATAVGEVPRIVMPEATGMVVPPANPLALAGALAHTLAQPGQGAAWGVAGRQRVLGHFSGPAMAQAYQALYDKSCSGKAAADTPAAK